MAPTEPAYTFRTMWSEVTEDLRACGGCPWQQAVTTLVWGTAFQLLLTYRLLRWLPQAGLGFLTGPLAWLQHVLAGSEISTRACLGRRVHFPHPVGIIIGAGVVVEDDVFIFQQVTLGSHARRGEDKGYPVICRGARLYAGAKVLGAIRVGQDAVVGANAVVLTDVPDGATAVGVPARILFG